MNTNTNTIDGGPRMASHTPGLEAESGDISPQRHLYLRAIGVMRRHLAEPEFGLKEAAGELYVSERTLQRLFASEGSGGFRAELLRLRMRVAERQLTETTAPVSDIAARVGYRQATHFAKAFRRVHGHLPHELRQRAGLPARVSRTACRHASALVER